MAVAWGSSCLTPSGIVWLNRWARLWEEGRRVSRKRKRERENKKRQKQSRSRGTAVYRKGTFRRRAASTEEESLVQFSHLLFCFHVKSSLPVACVDVTVSSSSLTFISVILLFLKKNIIKLCVFWSSFAECVCVYFVQHLCVLIFVSSHFHCYCNLYAIAYFFIHFCMKSSELSARCSCGSFFHPFSFASHTLSFKNEWY